MSGTPRPSTVIAAKTPSGKSRREVHVRRTQDGARVQVSIHSAAGTFLADARLDPAGAYELATALMAHSRFDAQAGGGAQ